MARPGDQEIRSSKAKKSARQLVKRSIERRSDLPGRGCGPGIEALGVISNYFGLDQGFWGAIVTLNENFGSLGYLIVAIFLISWIVSAAIYRWNGYDRIEARHT